MDQQQYYPPPPGDRRGDRQYASPPPPQQHYPPAPYGYQPHHDYQPHHGYQPHQPQHGYQPPVYEQNIQSSVAEKWEPRPKYQDLWALVLFLGVFVSYVAISYLGLNKLLNGQDKKSPSNNNKNDNFEVKDIDINTHMIVVFIVTAVVGFVLAFIYMMAMQRFPKPLIHVTLWLSVIAYFVGAAIFAIKKQYILAVLLGIFAIIYAVCAFTWRSRIPFAAVLLESVTSITKKYYGIIIIGFVGLFVQVGWSVWWAFSLIGAYRKWFDDGGCVNGVETVQTSSGTERRSVIRCENATPLIAVMIYLLFIFYWTSQVIKTIVHVTASGVYAAFYFLEGTPQGTGRVPTLSSLKRACTTSLGSICFGSLIIALISTMRAILQLLANSDDACSFFACCFYYILSWIESLIEYFNHYAYVQVAIYGKSYIKAAKSTWKLIKDRGIEAIINDNLIGNVLWMGSILIGALCALFGFAYLRIGDFDFNDDGKYTVVIVIICFVIGLMMTIVVTDGIDSGVATTFVALAEDPDALRRTKPELFRRIQETWPRVIQGL